MNERQQIIYMQTRMIRLASEMWDMSIETIVKLFTKYNVLKYIEECFDLFHMEGDQAILEDITAYLKNKEVACDGEISK